MTSKLLVNVLLLTTLWLAFVGDLLQYAVRIVISVLEQANLATHLVTLAMLVNRFGAALGLLLIGFVIDRGISIAELSSVYCAFAICLGVSYGLAARFPNLGLNILKPFIERYYGVYIVKEQTKFKRSKTFGFQLDIAIIFSVAMLGFLIPSLLAAGFPDYRATLLQTGFIVNSFATLYSALKIEKDLALTLNNGSDTEKWEAYRNFMFARAVGCGLATAILVIVNSHF